MADQVGQFLERLHRDAQWAYLWTKEGERKRSNWFPVGHALPTVTGNGANVYFGVHPVFAVPPTNSRGEPAKREDVRAQTSYVALTACLFSEFDAKDFENSKQVALAHVEDLDPAPSVIVDSGGGYHCYWLLGEPFYLDTDEDRQRADALQKAWVTYTGGDGDAKDLARVLRLPGTHNHKYSPPRAVQFVRCDLDETYTLPNLESYVEDLVEQERRRPEPAVRDKPFTRADDIAAAARNLERLSQSRCDDYNDWVAVGMALSELGDIGFVLWEQWSRKSQNYESGVCAEKWATFTPGGGLTLASLAQWAKDDTRPAETEPETDQESQPGRPRTPRLLTRDYIGLFREWGHTLRLNLCNDDIEVDGQVLTDVLEHSILSRVRDHGITHRVGVNIQHAREAMTTQAAANAYHPVRDYLDALTWDGDDHIGNLASYVKERPGSDKRFLRWFGCWIVGAVAKAYGRFQNPCLVLDGPQEIGKSYLARWLCPLDKLFFAGAVFPDVKDCRLRQMDVWIWEIEELGSTTRRADLEALKAFLSTETIRDRKPYAHRDLIKPALASFIGTINADAGFLVDRTGNRRFLVCSIEKIDWAYADDLDVNQLWAQAVYLYRNTGDAWMLSEAERAERDAANEEWMVDDPVEAFLREIVEYTGNPSDMVTLSQLLNLLRDRCTVSQRSQAMTIASVLKSWGAVKKRAVVDGRQQRVYLGAKVI